MVSFRTAVRLVIFSGVLVSTEVFALSSISSKRPASSFPDINSAVQEFFKVVKSTREAKVFEAPVRQDGIKLYIASDGDFDHERPGNGGIRLLDYKTDEHAIDDAIRLAEGMTRKHDMFRTGFSGAKLVANTDIPIDSINRKKLMEDIAKALEVLAGSVYTGCDLNTCDIDMDYLTEATNEQYVLAGRDSAVDTNVATAASVIGSILGLIESHEEDGIAISDLTFTVQGCGKVGSTVAKELVRLGAKKVQTCDIRESSAQIEGCTPIKDWASTSTDFLVPCANSLAITEEVAKNFPEGIKFCTGATNSPFAENAKAIFAERGVFHVPESISSAGAILADSVEWFDIDLYQTVEPTLMYGWIRGLSQKKAKNMVELAEKVSERMIDVVSDVVPTRKGDPIGKSFPEWIENNTKRTETLIVGGGMAGCSTAFALGEKNIKSILVERGPTLAPPSASSNGDSRMYRKMYSDEFFSKMQATALDRWKDVEDKSGQTLLQKNGLLFYGEDTGETVEGSVLGAKKTMENLNLDHTFFETGDSIAKAYPALKGSEGKPYSGVYEADAGHIKASKACEAMANIANEVCDIHLDTKIVSLDVQDEKVTATTEDGLTIKADNVVLAAGPWTNSVLESAGLPKLNIKVWEIQWAHYRVKKSVSASIPQAFHFRKGQCKEDGGLYYVFPSSATESLKNPDNGKEDEYTYVKVGVDFPSGGDLEGMDTFDYGGSEKVLELMDGWVAEHLPEVEERVESYTSPYTMTDDSYFVMDKVADQVAVFSGGSGRAFKFGPLIGDCMAALVTGEQPPVALERFSAFRESVATSKISPANDSALVPFA
ncbi:unnamed protein product [Pseudo-nitzschia multistriata]|uniref:Glutamate/phenylalanine/leucine/valine/L-tryptophan dehydrogenase C-terminal domain-containing protein n=1 Tax=Pseudo-nitzschia multistriata TaxID=183589 RepID=A0A448Z9G3_9STRA|nr:unnamed protein product [Pseudo-nitzschia multistriata]